ncbi:MAG: DNA mismatch repair protein MutS [Chitinophagia bacterium]|nr:DNA mismatch repair protein MutS [Chitinophagia bacterium]NCA30509.1 DNA mismatch repair protein MutS [Chitinophagia bacterium]
MSKSSADTPLMQQHRAIKQKYPDAILLFRVGDFYETFGEDAIVASKVLSITLTKRNNGAASSSELAGFPHHSLDTYLHKLVKAGHRVAICDQLEDPKSVKGIVKRGVTDMLTPGIATNDKLLEQKNNNFLAAIYVESEKGGIAFLDITTGEFLIAEGSTEYLDKLLQSLQPAEILHPKNYQAAFKESFGNGFYTYGIDSWIFDEAFATEQLLKQFQTSTLKGFGIAEQKLGIMAAGAILHYLKETEHPHLQHIHSIKSIVREEILWMDKFTIRNLELIGNGADRKGLLEIMDATKSPMGARLLKRWLVFPLQSIIQINKRLDAVSNLLADNTCANELGVLIESCGDLERLASKLSTRKIQPRELVQLAKSLVAATTIKELLSSNTNSYLKEIAISISVCDTTKASILNTLQEQPPATTVKGGFIKEGVSTTLDELRNISSGGKDFLTQIQNKEAEITGISSLKIGYNNVYGYYLEVTNVHKNKVPAEWIRKQTLTTAERYITPELKIYEEKIIGAEDKILNLEQEMYQDLLDQVFSEMGPIQNNGQLIGTLDCLLCFAQIAKENKYCKPSLTEDSILNITAGRHPVIEKTLAIDQDYIPNDVFLDPATQQIIILTGPNMSGKSAVLRQTALITLMAHMGSYVPATAASIPLTDKIFTRVGANDNLNAGESTFMVEMLETASILNNISARSLILLDEIGRGTSTYDGISIAWSIVEFLHQSKQKPKTLFATHYHELNDLEAQLHTVHNYHVSHKEVGNKIIFLRKLTKGGSTHSFGIHVAKMAGMPNILVNRANNILKEMELKNKGSQEFQLSIFDAHTETFESIRKELDEMDINNLTPVEALMKLQAIKKKLN